MTVIILNVLLFAAIMATAIAFGKFVRNREAMQDLSDSMYKIFVKGDVEKEYDFDEVAGVVKETQKKTYYEKVNEKLYYSGIRYKFRWATPTVYTAVMAGLGFAGFLCGIALGGIGMGLILTFFFPFILYTTLDLMQSINYSRIEGELILILNMIENFAAGTDDIITILEQVSYHVGKNMRYALNDCVSQARMTGDTQQALRTLRDHVEHISFKRLVSSLELASRGTCDYRRVVEEFRERMEGTLIASKRLDAVYRNCRGQVFAILAVGILVIYMSLGLVEEYGGFLEVINMYRAGQWILLALIAIYIGSVWVVTFRLRNRTGR